MADNRCSMCGNTNAADAQVCAQCGARLTPMRPSKPRNTGKFTGGLSWLDAFREETKPEDAGAAAFEQGESAFEEEMSSFEQESTPVVPSDDEEDAPEWLQRIRDRNESEQPSSSYDAEDEINVDEKSLNFTGEEENVPDWLRSLKDQDGPIAAQEEAEDIPSWQNAMRTWNTDGTNDYEEESSKSNFVEAEPKVTEWFSRIIPGGEEEPTPKPSDHFEPDDEFTSPKQTINFEEEEDAPLTFSAFESEEDEGSKEAALPDDDEFMASFKDYEHPSGFTDEEYAEAKGDDVEYEDWETRSASLYSVTESANQNEDVPSWLDEDGEGGAGTDSAQSVLNWLEELDEKEGGKQKARYWMGDVDTGELPPERAEESRYKAPEKKAESVYDPFAEDNNASPGSTQFFSENELDDDFETPSITPAHTMMFSQDDEEDIPDWLSSESNDDEFDAGSGKPGQTIGLSGLDDTALGMDLPEGEKAPWEMDSFGFTADEDELPKTPIMTAQLSDMDDEEEEGEVLSWLQGSSTDATEPRKKTPIMTAALDDLEDESEDETDAPWLQQPSSFEEEYIPKGPKMTASLPGLDDEDLGMDLEEDEIPPWLQHDQETEDVEVPKTPIMTAALDDFDDEEGDETLPWISESKAPVQREKPSLMTAALTGLTEEDIEPEEAPAWMQDIGKADIYKTPSQPLMTAELPDLGEESEEDELPPWMQEVDRAYDEQPSQPLMTAELPDMEQPFTEEEAPAWMEGVSSDDVYKTPSQPLMTAALTGFDEEEYAAEETPAWMQDVEEVAPPAKGTPTMTAALTGLDEDDFQTEETPAWMQDLEEIAPPPGTPIMTAALPDLDQHEPTMPPPSKQQMVEEEEDDIPDWMRTVEETKHLGRIPGQPAAESPHMAKSPFTVGLTGDADERDQSVDEMFSEDLLTTGKLNEMVGMPEDMEDFSAEEPVDEQSIDEMFSDQLLTTGRLNAMSGVLDGEQTDDELSIDEMFSDQLLTTGKLNAMVGQPGGVEDEAEEDQSIDEMFSDQLLTTGRLNAMSGIPGGVGDAFEDDQSVDEMFSDQLLTTGKLNAMVGMPGMPEESLDDEDQSVDELFSDQLLTTGKLNAMVGMPGMPEESLDDEDQSVDEMFSDQLLTTGILNKMQIEDQAAEGMSVDDAFSDDLLNTGKLRDLSAGLEPTQAIPSDIVPSNASADDDWLADFASAGSDDDDMLVGASLLEDEPAVPALPASTVSPAADMPDWLAELEPEGEEAQPSQGPAFVFDTPQATEAPKKIEESHPFAGDDLPNWLSPEVWQADGQAASEKAVEPADAGVANIKWELEGLEKGEMPSWLQQIKPEKLVTKKSSALTTEKSNEQSEKVGPLAGLSGVLPAQDMITMYRKPPVYSDQISLSEHQSNRMQILSRMMESEAKNKTLKVDVEKIPFNLMRTIFAVVLVIMMMIPLSGLVPITAGLPFAASDPVVAFFKQVEQFPEDSTVLLVMDFESGYTAEMRSSLDGLMMRLYEKNIDVAMISTLPTGPVIGEEIAQDNWLAYFAAHPEINVVDYETRVLNLGYLPGGSAAMLQFVRYPRQSVKYGFRYEREPTSVWETQVLSDIYSTNDFSGVVVITDSANVSRNWIEQTTLYSLNNILFITSAQTYPLILPYWQSGQVKGLIAGLYQGYTYRTLLGQSEGLASRWFSYQFGMNLVTIVVIFLTIIFVIRNTLPRIRRTR